MCLERAKVSAPALSSAKFALRRSLTMYIHSPKTAVRRILAEDTALNLLAMRV
jgi:hypothetical protein